jgi:putative ABC transport system ATP-binding protein
MSVAPAVEVRDVRRAFGSGDGRVEALRGVDLDVAPGEFVAVMGPSGSGKSTLLHLIGALDQPTTGTVRVAGQDLGALDDDRLTILRRDRIGFVFQTFNLLPVLTAEENVALPLEIAGASDAAARARAALERVGVAHRAGHRPREMSGGEQQRVALARALAIDPILLLADEPTGNLDRATGDQVLGLLRELAEARHPTIVVVTHDPRAAAMADRIVRLRDGRVVDQQEFPPPRPAAEVLGEL